MQRFSLRKVRFGLSLFLLALTLPALSWANEGDSSEPMAPLQFLWEDLSQKPGAGDTVRLVADIPDGWHVTSHLPEDEAFVALEAALFGKSFKGGTVVLPEPIKEWNDLLEINASYFEKKLLLSYPVISAEEAPSLDGALLKITYQACTDTRCDPPATLHLSWDASSGTWKEVAEGEGVTTAAEAGDAASPEVASEHSLLTMLLLALLGGMLLNIMPCVLPVLSLKIFSLVKQAGESRKRLAALGAAYSFGVLFSFWMLGLLVILIKRGGELAGWGFQMQNPVFLVFMTLLIGVFSFNLFGLFEISLGSGATTSMNKAGAKAGFLGAVLNGVFMTLLSTPCSAPMLGSSMGWALSQTNGTVFLFYTVVGLGLALPYFLLSLFPKALRFLPKPGDWMLRFKEFMGFILLLTAVWLLSVLNAFSSSLAVWTLAYLVILGMAVWAMSHLLPYGGMMSSRLRKWVVRLSVAAVAIFGFAFLVLPELRTSDDAQTQQSSSAKHEGGWASFSRDRIDSLHRAGIDVFVDFTADWCITCKANEKAVLAQEPLQKLFRESKPAFLVGDYTRKDPAIADELRRFKRAGVPMYVYYPADGREPHVFPEVITPEMLLKVIAK